MPAIFHSKDILVDYYNNPFHPAWAKDLISNGKLYTISKIYIECKDNKKVIYNGRNKD